MDAILTVSRETKERLQTYVALLEKWQKSQNLVAPATLKTVWVRHVADSAQAFAVAPDARTWVDLGSGAGFPGLVTGIILAEIGEGLVHLVESNSGKAAFLRAVARETGARVAIHVKRIEAFTAEFAEEVDAVSARALAPLDELLRLAEPLLTGNARGVFHKGQDFVSELTKATPSWAFDLVEQSSPIEAGSRIVVLSNVRRRDPTARSIAG
ncbi:MAG: 16S rRNA (guanine(527)-N(7))-methyltransferase RsmG [Ancalomicrobiaceae bacterium]|nr:16S rRNA (guanine(527)-N(7))-methyltransferase RsmG [Ancalomicrobiaceae bacterium]